MSLLSVFAERDEISADHTSAWQPFNADYWQVFLFDYPDIHNWAKSKYSDVADSSYSTAEKQST